MKSPFSRPWTFPNPPSRRPNEPFRIVESSQRRRRQKMMLMAWMGRRMLRQVRRRMYAGFKRKFKSDNAVVGTNATRRPMRFMPTWKPGGWYSTMLPKRGIGGTRRRRRRRRAMMRKQEQRPHRKTTTTTKPKHLPPRSMLLQLLLQLPPPPPSPTTTTTTRAPTLPVVNFAAKRFVRAIKCLRTCAIRRRPAAIRLFSRVGNCRRRRRRPTTRQVGDPNDPHNNGPPSNQHQPPRLTLACGWATCRCRGRDWEDNVNVSERCCDTTCPVPCRHPTSRA